MPLAVIVLRDNPDGTIHVDMNFEPALDEDHSDSTAQGVACKFVDWLATLQASGDQADHD